MQAQARAVVFDIGFAKRDLVNGKTSTTSEIQAGKGVEKR